MPVAEKAWITAAWDEHTSLQAIVLAKSLRKVVTHGTLVVLACQNISDNIRELLADTFDVLLQDVDVKTLSQNGLSVLDCAKISAWKFYWWKKCIFLESNNIVLQNCDELFDTQDGFSAASSITNDDALESTVFTFQPSYSVYKQLQKLASEQSFKNASALFKLYFQIWKPLPAQYFDISSNYTPEVRIASLHKRNPWKNVQKNGIGNRITPKTDLVSKQWLDLFFEEVLKNLSPLEVSATNLDLQKINAIKAEHEKTETTKAETSKEVHNYLQDSVAVIGYSCRFPGANNSTEFWELLKAGTDAITQMPQERLTESQLEDPKLTSVKAGFLKCPIDEFDAKFFGISPREAVFMDPQQRLLTEVAWEALENAGINPHSLKGSNTGVFTGVWTHEYEPLLTNDSMGANFHHVILGNTYSATSARVSYVLGLNGPNIVTESGCSSSMVSLHLACQSLRRNESSMTLVGGVNLLCAQFSYDDVSILAKDGHCKTFDEKADGFARGEGVGVLVLKKYSDAVRDGDRVMAIIRGTGISNEGTTNSFGTPSKFCQEIAIKEALKNSGVNPLVVDYVEAHGTGTPIGDPIEFGAIAAGYSGPREKPLIVGSVKTNIGHSEAAAGMAGLIKVMMAMENELIPQHRNLDTLNPNINLESVPAVIPTSPMEWPRQNNIPRIAGVSSFGISGTNVHVLIQEPPQIKEKLCPLSLDMAREHEVLTLSAKSEESVKELAQKYISYFDKNPNVNLKDVVFTANNGRANFRHRIAVVGKDVSEMKQNLQKELYISGSANINAKPVVAFLFTGQGSQYTGMAKSLYETSETFKDTLDSCASILRNNCTISLYDILWNDKLSGGASIDQTLFSQIAIFCVEYALLKLWESLGIQPDYVLGHSVGEFAAAVAAGVLDLKDAITLVTERSRLIHNLPQGKMLAVRASLETVKYCLSEFQQANANSNHWLDIAVINSNEEVVLAGKKDSMLAFIEFSKSKAANMKTQFLAASHAFHSRDMEDIMQDFGNVANAMKYKSPKCNYISGSTGKLLNKEDFGAEYWQKHARYCVDFASSIKSLESHGCNTFIEIGAHPILLALTMNNLVPSQDKEYLMLPSIRKTEHEWVTILTSVAKLYVSGNNIDWEKIRGSFGRKKLELPTYQFERQKFWAEKKSEKNEMVVGGKILHPLVGSKIPSAGNDHLYQHDLDLRNLAYLDDHQVANITILPGAGYLEMILASSIDTFKAIGKDGDSLFVSQFLIEAPLELDSNKLCRIQTVATPSEAIDTIEVKVFLYCNLNGYSDEKGWKCYASAKVSKTPFVEEPVDAGKVKDKSLSIDISTIKSECDSEITTVEYYKKVPEIGILFGKTFQSVSKIWKGKNQALGLIPVPENAGNMQDYIYHPIVLDAMIQAFGIITAERNEEKKELYLPVGIDKFEMIRKNKTSCMYAHVTWAEGQTNGHVALYDEDGKMLSVMNGIRLVQTSLTSFLNVINTHNNKLPGMFTEIWRGRDGPLQSRVDYSKLCSFNDSEIVSIRDELNDLNIAYETGPEGTRRRNSAIYWEILKTFVEIGWKPIVGETFTAKQLMTNLIISPSHEMFMDRLLEIFCEESILSSAFDDNESCLVYRVMSPIMSLNELQKELDDFYEECVDRHLVDADYVTKTFKHGQRNLGDTLLGRKSAVSALFGGEMDPFRIYNTGLVIKSMNIYMAKFIATFFENTVKAESMIRILEVGGGTGATTSYILSALRKKNISFRYTFTDISQQFLEEAKKKFKDYSGMEYKVLNLEKDPKDQGFSPCHYDVIIGSNVLHTISNLRPTIQYLRHLMVPSGILCAMEMFKPCRYVDLIFGIFDGYWNFKDFDLRSTHCTITQQKWEQLLSECGFAHFGCPYPNLEVVSFVSQASNDKLYTSDLTVPKSRTTSSAEKAPCFIVFDDSSDTSTMLRQQLVSIGSTVVTFHTKGSKIAKETQGKYSYNVNPDNEEEIHNILTKTVEEFSIHSILYFWSVNETRDQKYICQGLMYLLKFFANHHSEAPKVMVITRGNNFIGDQGAVHPSCATVDGLLTSFRNELFNTNSIIIDLDPDSVDANVESQELFSEIWSNSSDQERHVAFRHTRKYVSRYTELEKPPPPLRIPNQRYCLIVPTTKSLNDVTYRPVDKSVLQPTEVEIAVKATALNFRDIFVILKPDMYHTLFESVGSDFSGIISDIGSQVTKFKVGDEVFGISNNTSVASHVVVPNDLVMVKPKEFSFADACTLPSVFLTAYYCLMEVAQLKENETILIHVASGGVGLVAIQLAKLIGANIIATAGSKRKRAYLRSIGIEHVFHSRDISYGDEIERVTNGKGVHMVLNSITGPNFKETSLRVCAPNARFVEMGKVNIWQPEDVAKLRTDVQYTIVDVEKVERNKMLTLIDKMEELFKRGSIEPLPYTRFEGYQIKEALNYFLKAQHIGKIVVAMPEISTSVSKQFSTDILFNSGSTYLITGGLGGIGLEVAKWMAKAGAKNLVLVARSQPDEKTVEILNLMNAKGCRTLAYQVDVGNLGECEKLFKNISDPKVGLPPLRGVIHSAGALYDDFVRSLTWEKFEKVFNAKVKGGWNLHDLTKNMRLEFFVLFSSIAGTFGAPAQANHSAANCFLDSLARYRYSIGLPAQAIDWGAWAEVGAATNTVYGRENAFGVTAFCPAQGLSSLKYIITRPLNRVGVLQGDSATVGEYLIANKRFVEEIVVEKSIVSATQTAAETEAFWSDIKDLDLEERTTYIRKFLENIIRKTLKLPESEQLDEHQGFSEMGLDSLMAVEMRNKLQALFGKHITLNPTSLLDYPTSASLSKFLAEATLTVDIDTIEVAQENKTPTQPLGVEGLKDLIKEDSILPDHIKDVGGCVSPSNIRSILLTGATGHLGVYLLKETVSKKNTKITCLIRAKTVDIARKRLVSSLKKFDLLSEIDVSAIDIVVGNVTEKKLGLSEEVYANLSDKVDAIIHCAAKANHVEKYHKSIVKSDVRSVNTLGTLHVLEFASTKKTKRVIYPGSFSSANELTKDGYLSEKIPSVDNLGDGINFGYGISKLVAEKLIGQAIERGIPCTVLRLPTLFGHSETGHFTVDTNFFMRSVITLGQLQMAPDIHTKFYSCPIDLATKVIGQMIFNDQIETGLYNLVQPESITLNEFIGVAKQVGWNIKIVSSEEFDGQIRSNDNVGASLVSSFVSEDVSLTETFTNICPAFKLGVAIGKDVYCKSSKLVKIVPNFYELIPNPADTFNKHMAYAKRTGVLDAFLKL